ANGIVIPYSSKPKPEIRFQLRIADVSPSVRPVRRKDLRTRQQPNERSQRVTGKEQYLDRRWTALILLCAAQFVVVLDASIVNVALPSIGKGLHFSEQNLPWVVNAYVIAFGGFLLLGGRAADLLGRRRVFMVGLLVVAVASLAAGFAANQGQLIAARAAQGLGAAIASPAAPSLVPRPLQHA